MEFDPNREYVHTYICCALIQCRLWVCWLTVGLSELMCDNGDRMKVFGVVFEVVHCLYDKGTSPLCSM